MVALRLYYIYEAGYQHVIRYPSCPRLTAALSLVFVGGWSLSRVLDLDRHTKKRTHPNNFITYPNIFCLLLRVLYRGGV
jgi:hypothetical protein